MQLGEEGLETCPHLPEFLWDGLEEEHCLFDPISLSVPPTPPPQLKDGSQTEGGPGCHPTSTQMEGGQDTTPQQPGQSSTGM